jgi:hypothetical protein
MSLVIHDNDPVFGVDEHMLVQIAFALRDLALLIDTIQ